MPACPHLPGSLHHASQSLVLENSIPGTHQEITPPATLPKFTPV